MHVSISEYGNFIIPKPKFVKGDLAYFITEDRKVSAYKILRCRIICDVSDDNSKTKVTYLYNVVTRCHNNEYNIKQDILYSTREEATKALVLQIENDLEIDVVGCG